MDTLKTCSRCKELKSVVDFNKNKSKKDGLSDRCKSCCNDYNYEYRKNNKDKAKEYRDTHKSERSEYYINNKLKAIEYYKVYNEKNKSILSNKAKIYYKNNRDKINNRSKLYYTENKENILKYEKEYYISNKDKKLEYHKRYRELNKCYLNSKSRIYNRENYDKIKKYKLDNSENIRIYINKYFKTRRSCDKLFKLSCTMRSRILRSFKSKSWIKNNKTDHILGCDYKTAFNHIESKFIEGMNWDNHGKWHIDHIIPLSSAKTEEELIKLCHYTNLQPLWAIDNLKKGCRIL